MLYRFREFRSLCHALGFWFTVKYKLGLAREGKDFVSEN